MGLRPVEDALQFTPVGDILEGQVLDGSTGGDEAVELLMGDLLPWFVEGDHVFLGGVLRRVAADAHEAQIHLQGRGTDQAGELGLGLDLVPASG
jgi:hypothetical protein